VTEERLHMPRIEMDRLAVAAWIGASLLFVGCAGEGAAAAPPATATTAATPSAEDVESAADLGELHRHHHHGGVTMFIAMSLDSLGLPDQQTVVIEKIQGDLFAKMEPAHVAEQNVLVVLADGIGAGKVDDAKVQAAIDAVKTASAGLNDAAAQSLNDLHAALTPEQRAALADKVLAHWAVWKQANASEEKAGDTAHPRQLDWVAKSLGLNADQVEKTRAGFAERIQSLPQKLDSAQIEAHIQELSAAFRQPTFDAKTLQRGLVANQGLAVWGATRMACFYESLDPVLSPEQRPKLAAELKAHAAAKSGMFDAEKHER
jgi:Spy/CpxP family protein refolding chaperone